LRSFGVDEEIPVAAGDALRVLVAFPPAGASQGIFSGLRRALGRPTQVIAPDILSRGNRPGEELPLTALVAKLAGELHDRIGDRRYAVSTPGVLPYVLRGHVCRDKLRSAR